MKVAAKILGPVGLLLTVMPPFLVMMKSLNEPTMRALMVAGCLIWFASAPWFMKGGSE